MADDAILSAGVRSLQTNQERTLLLRVELELELVHPLLQLLDFAARGFFVFVLVGEIADPNPSKESYCLASPGIAFDNSS